MNFKQHLAFLVSLVLQKVVPYNFAERHHKEPFTRLRQSNNNDFDQMNRRSILSSLMAGVLLTQTPLNAHAVEEGTLASITDRVIVNVRISRQDGSFYVRDDLDDSPENKVFYGQLELGLFGELAPSTVKQFLSYVDTNFNPMEDNPMPSYARSSFVSFDQGNGLLLGGYIPSLQVTEFGGSAALKYGGRILPAPFWSDGTQTKRISHTATGLLTHRTLEIAPTFGITTRIATELDDTHTVFGQILSDDSSRAFLDIVRDLPTYSLRRPRGDPRTETPLDTVATAVFDSQRELFRSAAKSIGDGRLDKVYPGKLLRRVEVTQVKHL